MSATKSNCIDKWLPRPAAKSNPADTSNKLDTPRPGSVFICIGPNVFGKGETIREAFKRCKAAGLGISACYVVAVDDPEAGINDMGDIVHSSGSKCVRVAYKHKGQRTQIAVIDDCDALPPAWNKGIAPGSRYTSAR